MKIIFSSEKDKEKILKSIFKILENNKLLTLSTVNKNQSWCNTAYYVFDKKFNLYIWTGEKTIHSKNIKENNKVSINIFNSEQKWGSFLQGIQAKGNAFKVNNKELIKSGLMYIKRYPKVIKFVKNPVDFHSKLFESRMYKIGLNKIKVFDEKIFGKDEIREIIIKK